jgi:hypothetical protein
MARPAVGRTMFSKPLTYPSALDRRSASFVEGLWSPTLVTLGEKEQAKAYTYFPALFSAPSAEDLSLSGGASIRTRSSSS